MARRTSRGTYVRQSWDFLEVGDAIAISYWSAPNMQTYAVLVNNSTVGETYDIYHAEVRSSVAIAWTWFAMAPGFTLPVPFGGSSFIYPVNLFERAPSGTVNNFQGFPNGQASIIRQAYDKPLADTLELNKEGPFLSLPSNWAFGVQFAGPAGAPSVAMTIFYQVIADARSPSGAA